jgi:hypothetical protein
MASLEACDAGKGLLGWKVVDQENGEPYVFLEATIPVSPEFLEILHKQLEQNSKKKATKTKKAKTKEPVASDGKKPSKKVKP